MKTKLGPRAYHRSITLAIFFFSLLLSSHAMQATENSSCKVLFPNGQMPSVSEIVEMLSRAELQADDIFSTSSSEIYDRQVQIDLALGFDFRPIEQTLERGRGFRLQTALGEAKWSNGNSWYGYQTNYDSFVQLYRYLNIQPGQRIVDIGSGYGRSGFTLGFLYPQTEFVGYEIVPERVHTAQAVAARHNLSNVQFIEQDLSAPDFKIVPADFYYMYDPVNDETCRVLMENMKRANGNKPFKLVLSMGGDGKYFEIIREYMNQIERIRTIRNGGYYLFQSKPN